MSTVKNDVKPLPGYYMARISNYGIKKTRAGDPAPTIVFEVSVDGASHRVFWQGTLKDGPGRDITMKALSVCGFTNVRAFPYLADGVASGLLDTKKEVQITIEHEKAIDDPEKVYPRVKWINDAGGGKFKDAISTQDAIVLMQGMGLEGDFLRIAQENGFKVSNEPVRPKKREDNPFDEISNADIPF